ncbi:MAG: IS4 family transposase [Candidatus Competibacteraceae bacterium]
MQLRSLERLEPALALYLIIAWRILYLTVLGRTCPELPCDAVFADQEWHAAYIVTYRQPPPETPPSLNEMIGMIAAFGGFLNRKGDGFPSSESLWIGLTRCHDFVIALQAQRALLE